MLPLLEKELCEKRRLVTKDEILEYYALGQCTPGIIAVNTATFIGFKKKKVLGGIVATLGLITPSIIIITIISMLLRDYAGNAVVRHAFAGIRIVVVALVAEAVYKFFKTGVKNLFGAAVFAATTLVSVATGVSPVFIVLGAAVLGIIYCRIFPGRMPQEVVDGSGRGADGNDE